MADRILLESGAPDGYLLEDGTGVILMQVPADDAPDVRVRVGSASTVTSPLFSPAAYPTGQSVTASQGTVTLVVSSTVAPSGQSATSAQGTSVPVVTVLPTGQSVTASQGTASAAADSGVTTSPSGQEAVTSQGTASVLVDSAVLPTGQAATSAQGTVVPAVVALPSGQESTTAQGTVTEAVSSTVSPTGQAATSAQGTASAIGGSIVAPSGQSVVTSQGTVAVANDYTVAVSGQAITAAQGTASASGEEPEPPAATPIPYGEPIHPPHLRRQKQYQAPAKYPADPVPMDAVVAVSGMGMQARAGMTWQVADAAIAPVGQQSYAQGGVARARGMHNPTDEQIVEWLIQALTESV